jgi:hypothetical protein
VYFGQSAASPEEPAPVRPLALALVALSAFGVAACLTLLFMGMRGVMDLGGWVATGGPYEIAHPAPDWVWLIPVSIVCGVACGGLNVVAAWRAGGFTLLPFIWSALFFSLGWNFLEYGLRPPEGDGLVWGWIVCGVVFWIMAIPAVPSFYGGKYLWGRLGLTAAFQTQGVALGRPEHKPPRRIGYLAMNVAAIAGGVAAGLYAFRALLG